MKLFEWNGFDKEETQKFNEWISSRSRAFTTQEDYRISTGQKFGFHIHQPAKGAFRVDEDGTMLLTRNKYQPNLRTRISPMWAGDTQRWRYLKLDQTYRFEMEFLLPTRGDNYEGVSWANIFEIWGPFDGHDSGRNPAFEVMLRGKKGVFEFRQRGDTREDHDNDYQFVETTEFPFRHGVHTLVVKTKLSAIGYGSFTRVEFDGTTVMDIKNFPNTYNSAPFGDGEKLGGVINFPELYTPNASVANEPLLMFVSRILVTDGELEEQEPVKKVYRVSGEYDEVILEKTPKKIVFEDR